MTRIFLAGHRGMAGSALHRKLKVRGYEIITRNRAELDLLDQANVMSFYKETKPEMVVIAAAKVGGIKANIESPYEFLYENLQIQNNLINCAYKNGVSKIVFLGSSCIYPRECPQPMKESYLLTGPLEPTNEGYAIAKIAGLRLLQYLSKEHGLSSLSVMPCNLYGLNDSFDPAHSHVIAALVRRFVEAEESNAPAITMWGTGSARREFLHVDDMADAVMLLMEKWHSPDIINVGTGEDITIKALSRLIADRVGYRGTIEWDKSMPDGMPRKCLDVSRLKELEFSPKYSLQSGIDQMIELYRAQRKGR